MAPNLSEEQQVIVINFFGANTPKGLLCPYSPHRHALQEHRRNETKTECQHKTKLKFLFNLLFFTRSFNHQGSRIPYITLYGGVFFFHFMPVFQGLVSAETEWLRIYLRNEDLWSTILILLYEGWFNIFWGLLVDYLHY